MAGRLSSKLTEIVCLLASQTTFEVTSDLIKRILNVDVCPSTVKEVSEKIGEQLFNEEEIEAAEINSNKSLVKVLDDSDQSFAKRTYVQIDGAMINTVNQWKEN